MTPSKWLGAKYGEWGGMLTRKQRWLLLATAGVSSACGLAIELLLGTLASYLVGNQALAYGVAVGVFLAAMGLGAYLSQFVARTETATLDLELQRAFVLVELAFAPLSALLPLALFALFVVEGPFWLGLFLATILLGMLAGMELPLLTRLLERDEALREVLAGVLALDYVGALVGSLLLPLVLLPWLGMFPAAALIGSIPAVMVVILARSLPGLRRWGRWGALMALGLWLLMPLMVPLGDRLENSLYKAPVISRLQSPYQRLVLTRSGRDLRLFLDGDLQFSSLDEYRYHEALVHPALAANRLLGNDAQSRRVLLLGAGDGLGLREILKWPDVEQVTLIDLDPAVVKLSRHHPFLRRLNGEAYEDQRVKVLYGDAFTLAPQQPGLFDVIVADFPDPDREAIAKLYTQGFYQRLLGKLAPKGVLVTQATSPFFAPRAFASIATTLAATGLKTYPYTVEVPSFGPWGFVLASREAVTVEQLGKHLDRHVALQFLTPALLAKLFVLPGDVRLDGVMINRLSHPVLVRYELEGRWDSYD